ncbi:hypothetical protein C8J57DRAFT_1230409 [Mycena rebaudengoi]|nr:hypothetical protein C8J57DRAFT_1230409 [Mycena rebaudengoi]
MQVQPHSRRWRRQGGGGTPSHAECSPDVHCRWEPKLGDAGMVLAKILLGSSALIWGYQLLARFQAPTRLKASTGSFRIVLIGLPQWEEEMLMYYAKIIGPGVLEPHLGARPASKSAPKYGDAIRILATCMHSHVGRFLSFPSSSSFCPWHPAPLLHLLAYLLLLPVSFSQGLNSPNTSRPQASLWIQISASQCKTPPKVLEVWGSGVSFPPVLSGIVLAYVRHQASDCSGSSRNTNIKSLKATQIFGFRKSPQGSSSRLKAILLARPDY